MRLAQDTPPFKPVTLTLDSAEEADALWGIVNAVETETAEDHIKDLCIKISNWFSNHYKG